MRLGCDAVRLWLDRRIIFPRPSNACSNFDDGVGWTFFDLTTLHDEFRDEPGSVVEADFYHAATLLPMSDEAIVDKVIHFSVTAVDLPHVSSPFVAVSR